MTTDLTFITNEPDHRLKDRFEVLLKNTALFDCLVGYFYTSGFHALAQSLETTAKIRILIGISTDRQTYHLLDEARQQPQQRIFEFSHAETKDAVATLIEQEFADSEDNRRVEDGAQTFLDWVRSGKLEVRAYPSQHIHAKLYIMTFTEGDRDVGRVITGSSNFTQAGLVDNLEFNVELKNRSDYEFARQKFEELWQDAVDVSERYVQTMQGQTWLSQNITPYQLYLKFLYEYFKDELSQTDEVFDKYLPLEFKKLEYQKQAVLNAKKIVLEYGGVFIADVVGLGKTYIAAMLAGQLDGRTLVIAPPVLLEKANPGSWPNVFSDFHVSADFESLGKLDDLLQQGVEKYANIIIDEAHRFRTEATATYAKLAEICRGKKVILVTATPYNNAPKDILSLLKLFQNAKQSTIPNLPDLEGFFSRLDQKLQHLDRQRDHAEYIRMVKDNARDIRENVLKYLMVRRTRAEIERYFPNDLSQQGLKFPTIAKPVALFYELNAQEDAIFTDTIAILAQQFEYARYMPMLYYQGNVNQLEQQSQRNMGRFMKILLVKRLESSFFAFRNSIARFLHSYKMFIREFDNGQVYVSKQHALKIFELLENDDDAAVQQLIDEGQAERYASSNFTAKFRADLQHDHDALLKIKQLWTPIDRDPKLLRFLRELSTDAGLRANHLIIFTESKETAHYLSEQLQQAYPGQVLCYTGDSGEATRDLVIENFDARARHPHNAYRILVSTEVLAEGVNLHRANTVINYDIPWNPTRMMQRVGRINRVDTPFDHIYTFNFFPTTQSNDQIKLKEAAEAKINAFLALLGGDAELLTEGEPIGSHELFDRLISGQPFEGEEDGGESALKYLNVIKGIRDADPALFDTIKRLPKKARTAKSYAEQPDALLTYFRRGKLQKFFLASPAINRRSQSESRLKPAYADALVPGEAVELDFIAAAKLVESPPDEAQLKLPERFYDLLDQNKTAFIGATTDEPPQFKSGSGRDSAAELLKIVKVTLKNTQPLTDEQEWYLKKVLTQLEEGGLPKQTVKHTLKALNALKNDLMNPLKVVAVLQTHIPTRLLEAHYAEQNPATFGKREVILSMYLTNYKDFS